MPKEIAARVPVGEADPGERIKGFGEVCAGYGEEEAVKEAMRCLDCKKPSCVEGCPVEVDIPGFISLIKERDYGGAIKKIKEKNSLPGICGRVCPQESQCEKFCVMNKLGADPIAVGKLERYVADWAINNNMKDESRRMSTGKKVAVVGSGPAGLTCASELAKKGHSVTLFEALHKPGGVLAYGIPEFRLPNRVVEKEVSYIREMGVEIDVNFVVGKLKTVDELLTEYDAVFLGTGAGLPYFLNIPGENLNGVYSANEFLTRNNLMKAYLFPKYDTPLNVGRKVAVVGAGNVAVDSARTALRLGAQEVHIVYRRSRDEMPAREEEIKHAEEEGIILDLLVNPVEIHGDDKGNVSAMTCVRMRLGEPDSSGRRRPVPLKGSEFRTGYDTVIIAVGQGPNPLVASSTPGLDVNERGNIKVDERGETSRMGVFAAGDIVTGAATVISAMGAGKRVAKSICEFIG